MLHKVFPARGQPLTSAFNVVLMAEGYLAAERAAFHSACLDFIDRLLAVPPFNLTYNRSGWLNVYKLFLPSANAGPAAGAAAPAGRTVFESSFDAATQTLRVSPQRVAAVINAEQVEVSGMARAAAPYVGLPGVSRGLVLVVLLPPHVSPQGGELEYFPGADEFYFVATTQNGEWHQVILRAMGAMLSLADEFERPGADYLAPPTRAERGGGRPNIIYLPSPPMLNRDLSHWRVLIPRARQNSSVTLHARTAPPGTPDYTISTTPTTPVDIELWEGAGGYRTRMYRSAADCLMRRQIGNTSLPVRTQRVPWCYVCRKALQSAMG